MAFAGTDHQAWRLGGDEFAILLRNVHTEVEVQAQCALLSAQFLQPFNLHNGHTATLSLSIGYALAWSILLPKICKSLPIKICIG